MLLVSLLGCGPPDPIALTPPRRTTPADSAVADTGLVAVDVEVRLDGAPAPDATVYVGGQLGAQPTDDAGRVTLEDVPLAQLDDLVVVGSHPHARTEAEDRVELGETVVLELTSFDRTDNPDYRFQDPGNPDDDANTSKCAHCHGTIVADWFASPHATAASNPVVHDVYAGTASIPDPDGCAEAGGRWEVGIGPGTAAPAERCFLGHGTLGDVGATGGCADCHAPAIDGRLGGRDLLEATGLAYRYGVHCDLCHKVEAVDPAAPPGVGGALRIVRPSEPDPSPVGSGWRPLMFGPYDDVPHPLMGAVSRHLFHEPDLCVACHELWQPALVPGTPLDPTRWPDGRLPIHTTGSEWAAGPLSPTAPCQSCHMPPDPTVANSADLTGDPGISGGWVRPPGAVRHHSWPGPRQRSALVDLAAAVDLDLALDGGELTVRATVTNAGAGHAIPTGEPLRALLLRVEARCGDLPLVPTGGDVLPDWAGALDVRPAGTTAWPGAAVGDRIRVVARTGELHDPPGFGPFGDGTFDAAAKGLPVEVWAGEAVVVAVDGDEVTLDGPLPAGHVAYRVPALALPEHDAPALPQAGAPGFAFARVLTDAAGDPMVPHHRAVDVRSDNRLMPLTAWTSTHTFAATCAAPVAHAVLVHRPLPWALAAERRWVLHDAVIAEATR